jgi:hypothetical protein
MSRSYRKTRITGIAETNAGSMKWYKRYHSSQERMRVREAIHAQEYELLENEIVPWNEWDTPRDGKRYWHDDEWWEKIRRK